jgi:hypothetical protein
MDDGAKSVHGQTRLHTEGFTEEEVKFIQSVLKKKFKLNTRIERKEKNKNQ